MTGTVLIVDDDCELSAPLEIALAAMPDVRILLLTSSLDALRVLANPDCQVIAVVTDLNLPLMNGFELIESIRRHKRYAHVPVVVITGDSHPATRRHAFQTGASAYFPKPYSPADLRNELERLLHAS